MSAACQSDLACFRNDGHAGAHAYATPETVPQPVLPHDCAASIRINHDLADHIDAERARHAALVAAAREARDWNGTAWKRDGEDVATIALRDVDALLDRLDALSAALPLDPRPETDVCGAVADWGPVCPSAPGHPGDHDWRRRPAPEPEYLFDPSCGPCRNKTPHHPRPAPDTALLLLIADCLVALAWKAEPDAGVRHSRLAALAATEGEARDE